MSNAILLRLASVLLKIHVDNNIAIMKTTTALVAKLLAIPEEDACQVSVSCASDFSTARIDIPPTDAALHNSH